MLEGLKLTVMGMGTVFFFLILLVLLIQIIGALYKPGAVANQNTSVKSGPSAGIVAAITSAISNYEKEMES